MGEDKKKPAVAAGKKKYYNNDRFGGRANNPQMKNSYTSNMAELKDDVFDFGNLSDLAKYSKSLKNIETYIQRTYKMPDDIVKAIQSNKRPVFDPPEKPNKKKCVDEEGDFDADKFEMAKFTWKEDWKLVNQRKIKYEENDANAWALVYNQCSHELRVKLKGTSQYEASKRDNDLILLLAMIRGYCCQFDALNDEYVAIVMAIKNLPYYFQKPSQTNSDYHQDFLAMIKTIEDYGGAGSLTYFPNMIKKELIPVKQVNGNSGTTTPEEQKEARKIV
jgi:hypothetical protein